MENEEGQSITRKDSRMHQTNTDAQLSDRSKREALSSF